MNLQEFHKEKLKELEAKPHGFCHTLAGLGAGEVFVNYISSHSERPVLIVAPASMRTVWGERFDRKGIPFSIPKVGPLDASRVIIVSYEFLHNNLQKLIRLQPRVLIFDEPHGLFEVRGQRMFRDTAKAKSANRLAIAVQDDSFGNKVWYLVPTGCFPINETTDVIMDVASA